MSDTDADVGLAREAPRRVELRRRLLRAVWRGRQQLWDWAVDLVLYTRQRLRGRAFVDFYAEKMDRLAVASPTRATGRPEAKRFQFDYLAAHGLKPSTAFLDYGCGTAAAGIHVIEFLDPGNYVGVDISARVLDVARERVSEWRLDQRRTRFLHLPSGALGALEGLRFDIIWAQSVLTHMPPDDIRALLRNLREHLNPGGVFYATFAYSTDGIQQRRVKDWYYDPGSFKQLAAEAGYACHLMTDWRHPDGEVDRLARLTLDASSPHQRSGPIPVRSVHSSIRGDSCP